MRRLRDIVGTTLVLAVVTAVPARADILIGFVGPLTGEMELAGEQMGNGAELAVTDQVSETGGKYVCVV